MKLADVEARAQCAFGLAAQRADPDFADLVRKRLPGPGDIPLDLGDDVRAPIDVLSRM